MPRRIPRTILLALIVFTLAGINAFLLYKRSRYSEETARLREGMTSLERARADAIIDEETDRTELMVQLARRQALGDDALHLAVSADSSFVALDRGGVRLRTMPAQFGPQRRVGIPPDTLWVAVPQGMRRIERQIDKTDRFELPAWVWTGRGLTPPEDRSAPGLVGADAIVTSGGTLLYSMPETGPLADSSYVMPGTIRLSETDLKAIKESISLGMRVYFF